MIAGQSALRSGLSESFLEQMYSEFLQAFRTNDHVLNGYLEVSHTRFTTFKSNLARVQEHNSNPSHTWKMGINRFSDMTWEEFKSNFVMEPQHCSATNTVSPPTPARSWYQWLSGNNDIDWKAKEKVSGIKDQGRCGSCWTFSTTGCVESRYSIRYGNHIPMYSEQQLIDCAEAYDNHGCSGGLPSHAFEYINSCGLEDEGQYAYEMRDGKCRHENRYASVHVGHAVNITQGDNQGLENALQDGPVSVTFQVVEDFRHYESGVYQSTNCKNGAMDVNHAVLATGLGTESSTEWLGAGTPYFAIKNSWGFYWGDQGYFKILRGDANMCGILTCNSYPEAVWAA